jgi:hypothetical protein
MSKPGRRTSGGPGARRRALRLLAREKYADYVVIYEQVRPAAQTRYQARDQARAQLRSRYRARYLELYAQEQAGPPAGVPAGIRSKSWQRALSRLADLRAPAYRELFEQFRAQGMNRPRASDRAMAGLREAESGLFERLLAQEYELWLNAAAAGPSGAGRDAMSPGAGPGGRSAGADAGPGAAPGPGRRGPGITWGRTA